MSFIFKHPRVGETAKPVKAAKAAKQRPSELATHVRRRFPVPGTDRIVMLSTDMIAQFEQLFYAQYDRVLDRLPLLTGDRFGNFEPAFYLQIDALAPERSFSVLGNPRDGQYFDPNVETDLRPSAVIQTSTPFSRVADLIVTMAYQSYVLSKGTETYDWSLRAVVERQTDNAVYKEHGMPGKGWVCIRRATQDAVEKAVAQNVVPGSIPGMAPWVALDAFPFPNLAAVGEIFPQGGPARKKTSGNEVVNRIAAMEVGSSFTGKFQDRGEIYALVKRAKLQALDDVSRRFTIHDVEGEDGNYEIVRAR